MPALIFDCDGVLADTERHGHLPAFNQMFAEFGVPVRWSEKEYGEKLKIGGGKERMLSLFTPAFVAKTGLPTDPAAQQAEVARWHKRKTEIYVGLVEAGLLPARPGVARLAEEALAAGWTVAVATTTAPASIRAVLEQTVGKDLAARFAGVFAGDVVPQKKPAPDIYRLTLAELGIDAACAVAIEDSRNGLLAASGAGIACVITVSGYTEQEDFGEAALVVSDLGEPGAPMRVIANRSASRPEGMIRLDDLAALVERPCR